MLKNIKINNFALIEDIEIDFDTGLTVLTGETGTGKSIILEALYLIFAKRSDQEMIRHGSDKAVVSAVFSLSKEKQNKFELEKEITISREIDLNGRHKITLNNKPITLGFLKTITDDLGLIHSQEDSLKILDHGEYLNFIDLMDSKSVVLLNNYLLKRSNYLEAKKHLEKLLIKKDHDIEQREYLEYQLNEIKNFNLKVDEKENLESKISLLANFDKISTILKELNYLLNESLNIDNLYLATKLTDKIKTYDEAYLDANIRLSNAYYELKDVNAVINDKLYELDFDESEFDFMQERVFEISKLEDKYKKSQNELIDFMNEIEESLSLIDNYDDYILTYKNKVKDLFKAAYNEGIKLSEFRKSLAIKFEKLIINELADLDLTTTQFKVDFKTLNLEDNQLYDTGLDEIEFLISLNEGEPKKPLAKVASGGERARFIFAIKSIYANQNNLDVLILDEIDIGISGKTAAKVAKKMEVLSQTKQLIVISHLPQVAARAKNHYGISKKMVNSRMVTNITLLDKEERIKMIALMLSDESLSEFAIEQAKMLLKK